MTQLRAGDRLGAYEIIDRVGFEPGCTHYRARPVSPSPLTAAVLVKRYEDAQDGPLVAMWLSEAALGKRLQHPNIARLYELGREDGYPFLVLEYVDGESVRHLSRRRRWSISEAVSLGVAVAAGLDHAHELTAADGTPLGISHRGLSPETVLVGYDGGVKLIDFAGLTGALAARTPSRRGDGDAYRYLSPEQARGLPPDRRSDLFALGVMLHELLTGATLFAARTDLEVLTSILKRPLEAPSQRAPRCPASLDRLVMAALERDPERRPRTAREVGAALEAVAREQGLECSPQVLVRRFEATGADLPS